MSRFVCALRKRSLWRAPLPRRRNILICLRVAQTVALESDPPVSLFASKIFAAFGEIGEQAGEEFVRQAAIDHFPTKSPLVVVFLEDSEGLFKWNRAKEGGQM